MASKPLPDIDLQLSRVLRNFERNGDRSPTLQDSRISLRCHRSQLWRLRLVGKFVNGVTARIAHTYRIPYEPKTVDAEQPILVRIIPIQTAIARRARISSFKVDISPTADPSPVSVEKPDSLKIRVALPVIDWHSAPSLATVIRSKNRPI